MQSVTTLCRFQQFSCCSSWLFVEVYAKEDGATSNREFQINVKYFTFTGSGLHIVLKCRVIYMNHDVQRAVFRLSCPLILSTSVRLNAFTPDAVSRGATRGATNDARLNSVSIHSPVTGVYN